MLIAPDLPTIQYFNISDKSSDFHVFIALIKKLSWFILIFHKTLIYWHPNEPNFIVSIECFTHYVPGGFVLARRIDGQGGKSE